MKIQKTVNSPRKMKKVLKSSKSKSLRSHYYLSKVWTWSIFSTCTWTKKVSLKNAGIAGAKKRTLDQPLGDSDPPGCPWWTTKRWWIGDDSIRGVCSANIGAKDFLLFFPPHSLHTFPDKTTNIHQTDQVIVHDQQTISYIYKYSFTLHYSHWHFISYSTILKVINGLFLVYLMGSRI